jgi:hypothetical protein
LNARISTHHDRNNDNLLGHQVCPVNDTVWEPVKPVSPVVVSQQFPGVWMFQDSIDSPPIFFQQLSTNFSLLGLVEIESALEIVLRCAENDRGH